MDKFQVTLKNKSFKIKITLGFWKRCGFTREEAEIITKDADKYLNALKLAVFYGNKEDFGWKSLEDMSKMLTDDDFEDVCEDYSQLLSEAMLEYLPLKLRTLIKNKMDSMNEKVEKLMSDAIDEIDQKKN